MKATSDMALCSALDEEADYEQRAGGDAAPTVTLTTARLDRRVMLGILMTVLAVADVLAAVATAYWVI